MRQLVVTTLVAGDLWLPGDGFVDPLEVDGGWWSLASRCEQLPVDPDVADDARVRLPRLDRVLADLRQDPSVPDVIEFVVLLARHEPARITDTAALAPVIARWAEVHGVGAQIVVTPPDVTAELAAIRSALAHLGTLADPASVALAVPADHEVVHLVHAIEVLDALPALGRVEITETPTGQPDPSTSRRTVPTMLARRLLGTLLRERIENYELIAARRIAAEVPDLLTADGRQLLDAAARYCQRNAGPLQELGGWVLDDRPALGDRPAGAHRHLHDTRRLIHALDLCEWLWLLERDEEDVAWFLCVALIELLPSAWLESLAAEVELGWPETLPGRQLTTWLAEADAGPAAAALMEVGERTLQLLGWQVADRDHLALARFPLAALAPTPLRTRQDAVLAVADHPVRAALRELPQVQGRAERTALVWAGFSWELRALRNQLAHDLLDLDRGSLEVLLTAVVSGVTMELERLRPGSDAQAMGSPEQWVAAVTEGRLRLSDDALARLAGSQASPAAMARRLVRARRGERLEGQDLDVIAVAARQPDPLDLRRSQILAELAVHIGGTRGERLQRQLRTTLRQRSFAPWSPPQVFDEVAVLLGDPQVLIPRAPFDPADAGEVWGPRRLLGACLPEVIARPNALRVCRSLLLADLDR